MFCLGDILLNYVLKCNYKLSLVHNEEGLNYFQWVLRNDNLWIFGVIVILYYRFGDY